MQGIKSPLDLNPVFDKRIKERIKSESLEDSLSLSKVCAFDQFSKKMLKTYVLVIKRLH